MTAKKRRGGARRGQGNEASAGGGADGGPGVGSGGPSGGGSVRTEGGRGLILTIWAAVALVLVTGFYRAGRDELALGHWLAFVVVVLMGVAVTLAVTRDPEA